MIVREPAHLDTLGSDDLMALKIPERELLLDPILPTKGLMMIHAKRGGSKTFLLLRWSAPKARRVLYVDGEMSLVDLQKRVAALIAGLGVNVSLPAGIGGLWRPPSRKPHVDRNFRPPRRAERGLVDLNRSDVRLSVMALPRGFQLDRWQSNFANTLAATELGPNIHDRSATFETVGPPVSAFDRSPDLILREDPGQNQHPLPTS
jgi:hypothetical protein